MAGDPPRVLTQLYQDLWAVQIQAPEWSHRPTHALVEHASVTAGSVLHGEDLGWHIHIAMSWTETQALTRRHQLTTGTTGTKIAYAAPYASNDTIAASSWYEYFGDRWQAHGVVPDPLDPYDAVRPLNKERPHVTVHRAGEPKWHPDSVTDAARTTIEAIWDELCTNEDLPTYRATKQHRIRVHELGRVNDLLHLIRTGVAIADEDHVAALQQTLLEHLT